MPAPDMLTGMRAPRSVRLEDIKRASTEATPLPATFSTPGVNVYVSASPGYRVQVTAPSAYIDPASGRKNTGGKMHVAQFENGIFRNNDRDPAVRALFDEALQSNKYFGKFGGGPMVHFWLMSDMTAQTESAKINSALDTLRSLPPEMVAQYVADLQQGDDDDHAFSAQGDGVAAKSAKQARPIPVAQ